MQSADLFGLGATLVSFFRNTTLASVAMLAIGPSVAQTQPGQIEMIKPDRCSVGKLQSVEPVRCFAWATTSRSGSIDNVEARCTNPDFVPVAKRCLDNHRMKKEHRGSEQKVCVEFTYIFGDPQNYFGNKMQSNVTRTRVLPACEVTVAPS